MHHLPHEGVWAFAGMTEKTCGRTLPFVSLVVNSYRRSAILISSLDARSRAVLPSLSAIYPFGTASKEKLDHALVADLGCDHEARSRPRLS